MAAFARAIIGINPEFSKVLMSSGQDGFTVWLDAQKPRPERWDQLPREYEGWEVKVIEVNFNSITEEILRGEGGSVVD